MTLTPSSIRNDLKCGNGAISKGEKCTKGAAPNARLPRPARLPSSSRLPQSGAEKRATVLKAVGVGVLAVALASDLTRIKNTREGLYAKFGGQDRFKPFQDTFGNPSKLLKEIKFNTKEADTSLLGTVSFGELKGKQVVLKEIKPKISFAPGAASMMEAQGLVSRDTAKNLRFLGKNLTHNEVSNARLAGELGFGPKVKAAGNNMMISELAEGRPLVSQELGDRIGKKIVKQGGVKGFKDLQKVFAAQRRLNKELPTNQKQRVLASLAKMHTAGVAHNDLHPGNIFVSNKGAQFIDYGTSERGGAAVSAEFVRLMNPPKYGLNYRHGFGYNLKSLAPREYAATEKRLAQAIGKRIGRVSARDIRMAAERDPSLEPQLQSIVDDFYAGLAKSSRSDALAAGMFRSDACWAGYEQVGFKRKGKRRVPNCVPIRSKQEQDTEDDGKKYTKVVTNPETGRKNKVRYGAKGYKIAPGTSKGDRYCARSFGDMKSEGYNCSGAERNTPLCLSRAKWKCSGKRSRRDNALTPRSLR